MALVDQVGKVSIAQFDSESIEIGARGFRSTIPRAFVSVAVAIVDMAIIVLAAMAVKELYVDFYVTQSVETQRYGSLGFIAAPLAYLILQRLGLYDVDRLIKPSQQLGRLLFGLVLAFVMVVTMLYMLRLGAAYSRGWMIIWFVANFILLAGERLVVGRYLNRLQAVGRLSQRVAIYGAGKLGRRVLFHLSKEQPDIEVVGVFDDDRPNPSLGTPALRGGLDELVTYAQKNRCSRIIIALPLVDRRRIRGLMKRLSVLPVDVQFCTDVFGRVYKSFGSSSMGRMQLFEIQSRPLSEQDGLLKAGLDFVLAGVALLLAAPLFVLVAAAIKLDSRGPVFFLQKRHGFNNQVIRVFKFRTMTVMEDGHEVKQATNHDPRVTRVGRFLRRTSLDEIPQLINVVKGEMSLVGPRPHPLVLFDLYGKIIGQYPNRHRVKPGLTGWAQVNGLRGETRDPVLMRRRVEHDLYYIENWSIALDIEILLRTVVVVLTGKAAY